MARLWLVFLAGVLGGAGGSFAYQALKPARSTSGVAIAGDDAVLREIREELAALRREIDRPALLAARRTGASDAPAGADGAAADAPAADGSPAKGTTLSARGGFSAEDLEA